MTAVKICGITTPEALEAAASGGARFIGLVFHPPSPRFLNIPIAAELSRTVPTGVRAVGLFVNPDNAALDETLGHVQLDMIQLHGNESPGRVAEIKARFNIPVIKALSIGGPGDLAAIEGFEAAADWILCDAKSSDPNMPGGTGTSFDWGLLSGHDFKKPWMLAGGLTADNVANALSRLHPDAVDVSSGVETRPGEKSPEKIRDFIRTVKNLEKSND